MSRKTLPPVLKAAPAKEPKAAKRSANGLDDLPTFAELQANRGGKVVKKTKVPADGARREKYDESLEHEAAEAVVIAGELLARVREGMGTHDLGARLCARLHAFTHVFLFKDRNDFIGTSTEDFEVVVKAVAHLCTYMENADLSIAVMNLHGNLKRLPKSLKEIVLKLVQKEEDDEVNELDGDLADDDDIEEQLAELEEEVAFCKKEEREKGVIPDFMKGAAYHVDVFQGGDIKVNNITIANGGGAGLAVINATLIANFDISSGHVSAPRDSENRGQVFLGASQAMARDDLSGTSFRETILNLHLPSNWSILSTDTRYNPLVGLKVLTVVIKKDEEGGTEVPFHVMHPKRG